MQFAAHGKLMLTGEYFVLDGAKSLAFPTKKGQTLSFEKSTRSEKVFWKSLDQNGKIWFETEISCETLKSSNQNAVGQKLEQILLKARALNAGFIRDGGDVEVRSDFNLQWGFGSSSTLVSLVAQWANVDPYKIQFECFGGSGYDIACATAKGPIVYTKQPRPNVASASFHKSFINQLYFVYLGQKQNSREGIAHYRSIDLKEKSNAIAKLNSITRAVLETRDFDRFCQLLQLHEEIVGQALKIKPVKERLFPDFKGTCKSLGAWGGDFILAASLSDKVKTTKYFEQMGFATVLPFNEVVLS